MSVLIEASTLVTADGGVLDLINGKSLEVERVGKTVARAAITCFLIVFVLRGGFTLGKMMLAVAMAGLFLWLIGDVEAISDRFDSELNAAAAQVVEAAPVRPDGSDV